MDMYSVLFVYCSRSLVFMLRIAVSDVCVMCICIDVCVMCMCIEHYSPLAVKPTISHTYLSCVCMSETLNPIFHTYLS